MNWRICTRSFGLFFQSQDQHMRMAATQAPGSSCIFVRQLIGVGQLCRSDTSGSLSPADPAAATGRDLQVAAAAQLPLASFLHDCTCLSEVPDKGLMLIPLPGWRLRFIRGGKHLASSLFGKKSASMPPFIFTVAHGREKNVRT